MPDAPTPSSGSRSISDWSALACGAIVAAVGAAALTCWFGAWGNPVTLRTQGILMAPSTSLASLLLGGALVVWSTGSARRPMRLGLAATALLGAVLAGSVLINALILEGQAFSLDRWFLRAKGILNALPTGQMSPVTATCFLAACLAVFLLSRQVVAAVGILGTLIITIAWLGLTGYWYGVPWIYGGEVAPMTISSIMASISLGAGLIAAGGPRSWPLSVFSLAPLQQGPLPYRGLKKAPVGILFLLIPLLGAGAYSSIRRQYADLQAVERDKLNAIADLKVGQIKKWYEGRAAGANFLFETSAVADTTGAFIRNPSADHLQARALELMDSIRRNLDFTRVVLLDGQGQVRLASPPSETWVGSLAKSVAIQAWHARQVRFSDLHLSTERENYPNADFLVPLLPTPSAPDPSPEPIGLLLLETSAEESLFPIIQTWPTPSPSAETLLVRREGNEILFLNELRHRLGGALIHREPLDNRHTSPAALAIQGQDGVVAGVDYRGVPVLAALRRVPGLPWHLVAKVDQAEVYAPVRNRTTATMGVMLVLTLAAVMSIGLLQRRLDHQQLLLRLQDERKLRESEELFHRFAEASSHGFGIGEFTGRIVFGNPALLRILEADDYAAFLAKPFYQYYTPDGAERLNREILPAVLEKGQWQGEFPLLSVRGHLKCVEQNLFLMRDEWGNPRMLGNIITDITDRKRAEETLRASENRFATIFRASPIGVGITRLADGHILDVNSSALQTIGYERDEAIGRTSIELNVWADPAERARLVAMIRRDGRVQGLETRFRRKSGEMRDLLMSADMIELAGEQVLLTLWMDISERKRAEEKVHQLNAELERRVRERTAQLEAANRDLNEFAYVVSHDLKAPLRGIAQLAHWLIEDHAPNLGADAGEKLQLLIARVTRMHNLIDGILAYSRIGRLELQNEPVDLTRAIHEVIELLSPPRHVSILMPETLPVITADRTRIHQVFQNLIGNAIKFMDKPDGRISITCEDLGTAWRFSVTDNGPGIDPKYHQKVFGVFQTLSPRDQCEGTGIGLAVVKRIVELYGGQITLQSAPGQGCTFAFTWPK